MHNGQQRDAIQNLKLNDNTGLVTTKNALLHTGQMLLLKKGSKEGKMIISLHPGEGVWLGNLFISRDATIMIRIVLVFDLRRARV